MSVSVTPVAVLLLWCSSSVLAYPDTIAYRVIYVNSCNGTFNKSCWNGGEEMPCASLELALEGAEYQNSTTVIVEQSQCVGNTTNDNSTLQPESETILSLSKNVTECPAWTYLNGTSTTCECGDSLGRTIICDSALPHLFILQCYCMTYSNFTRSLVVGVCPYYCFGTNQSDFPLYSVLPSDASGVEAVCGHLNRQGQLCGECKEGFTPAVYSYELECVRCSTSLQSNLAKYIFAAFLPQTFFLILVLILRIRASSPKLKAFIILSQIGASPLIIRNTLVNIQANQNPFYEAAVCVILAVYGIWNLDFFRTLLPPICLNVSTRQALAMDYIVAFYPLVLTALLYGIIELHDHGCIMVTWLWKPFHKCFVHFRKQWDIRNSTIDAFVTFLLSYSKIFLVSIDLVLPTQVHNMDGQKGDTLYSFWDATVELYSKEQIAIAVAVYMVLLVFTIFPVVIMIVYPTKCFQKQLGCCHLRRQQAVHTFMTAFNGYYKDGTDGTYDCRYYAAVDLFIRIVPLVIYAVTLNIIFVPLAVLSSIALAVSVTIISPYRTQYSMYNKVDAVMSLILAMGLTSAAGRDLTTYLHVDTYRYLFSSLAVFFNLLPLAYISVVAVHWLFSQSWMPKYQCHYHVKFFWKNKNHGHIATHETTTNEIATELPDRVINPGDYQVENTEDTAMEHLDCVINPGAAE